MAEGVLYCEDIDGANMPLDVNSKQRGHGVKSSTAMEAESCQHTCHERIGAKTPSAVQGCRQGETPTEDQLRHGK